MSCARKVFLRPGSGVGVEGNGEGSGGGQWVGRGVTGGVGCSHVMHGRSRVDHRPGRSEGGAGGGGVEWKGGRRTVFLLYV